MLSNIHGGMANSHKMTSALMKVGYAVVVFFLLLGPAVSGEMTDAKKQAESILAKAGCTAGFDEQSGLFAVIGVYRADIHEDATAQEIEKIRQKGIRCALLEAKGKMAMSLSGRNKFTRQLDIVGDVEEFRSICNALANMQLLGCKELPCSESWSKSNRLYKVAIPLLYNKRWGRSGAVLDKQWNDLDSVTLAARINRLDSSQRIGCFKHTDESGQAYVVAFGSSDITDKTGKELHKRIKEAQLRAISNMGFWLKSDISAQKVAETCVKSDGNSVDNLERFSEIVSSKCEHKGFPVHEVASGRGISPISGRRLYWCALGARLAREDHAK